jgi:uncharacterized protein (TIGR04255 family)
MLTVPPAPRFRMTSAPLVEAVAQVSYPIVARLQSLEGIAPLQDALFDLFPYMTQQVVQEVSLMIGPAGPAAPESAKSTIHQFTDDDGWRLSVTVSSASLSVGPQYAGVDDFAGRFRRVCAALHDIGRVRRCDRLGVRYLDLVELTEGSDEWASWFRPDIVGLASPDLSDAGLIASLTETRLQQEPMGALSGPMLGVIRHGVVPPGSVMQGVPPRVIDQRAFLLDMDTYVQSPQPFEPERLAEQYLTLHGEIEKVFHWAVTDAGRERFGYELMA